MSTNRPTTTPPTKNGKPSAGTPRPAPKPQPAGTRVRPVRPQNAPRPTANPPNRLPAILIGGGAVLVALILLSTMFFNTTPRANTGVAGTAPTAAGSADTAGAVPTAGAATTPAAGANTGAVGTGSTAVVETPKGTFKIKLFTDDPAVKGAVNNFRNKVASGYFDGKIFHRVEDWVIQGGDPLGNGTGGGDMPGEYTSHPFVAGAVGMASTGSHSPMVNDSQWFVCKTDCQFLNNNYVIFGQVTEGMDVVNKIAIGDTMTKITMQP
jgi:peptidyl-prolyl cis-trans isomerase B (cyclophilin B)